MRVLLVFYFLIWAYTKFNPMTQGIASGETDKLNTILKYTRREE